MMAVILGVIICFIDGIVLGIIVNIMTMIDDDLEDDQDYGSLYNIERKKYMLRVEVTIIRDKSDPVHYLEHRAKDIVSKLWENDVYVTKVTFKEENGDILYSYNIGS